MNETAALRILVIEDHSLLRAQIVALLRDAGHVVEEASDGRLGLQMALEQPPDVLVLDLGLPGLDGVRLCRALRESTPAHVPVLMLTARDSLDDKAQGFAAGADDYLVKPFAGEELLWRCRALSRRYRLGQPHVLVLGDLRLDRARGRAAAMVPPHLGDNEAVVAPVNLIAGLQGKRVWLLTADDDDHASPQQNQALFDAIQSQDKKHLRFDSGHLLSSDDVEKLSEWFRIKPTGRRASDCFLARPVQGMLCGGDLGKLSVVCRPSAALRRAPKPARQPSLG